MKLTKSQWASLAKMGKRNDNHICCYGVGCGINKSSVRVLARLGLAIHDEEGTGGICCRITDAGRLALAEAEKEG